MDMNFPHADLGQTQDKAAYNIHVLLSNAMASQVVSPTYKAMMRQAELGSQQAFTKADKLQERIQFFSGRSKTLPQGAFLPADLKVNEYCAEAEQIGEDSIYQTASMNSKDQPVSRDDTGIISEFN